MTRYLYQGPLSSVTIQGVSIGLIPGKAVDLDPDHPYTLALRGQGRLLPDAPSSGPEAATTAKKAASLASKPDSKGEAV